MTITFPEVDPMLVIAIILGLLVMGFFYWAGQGEKRHK